MPTEILNSSPLPSVTEHQSASNDSEVKNSSFLSVAPMEISNSFTVSLEMKQQSHERKVSEEERSHFLSAAPMEILNSSPLPPERENQSLARKESELENSIFHSAAPSRTSTVVVDWTLSENLNSTSQEMEHQSSARKESEIENSSIHYAAPTKGFIALHLLRQLW